MSLHFFENMSFDLGRLTDRSTVAYCRLERST